MYIGMDVGGTHTDCVLVDDGRILASAKVRTRPDDLLWSVRSGLEKVLAGRNAGVVQRFNLSTTLTVNALMTGTADPVGMLVSAGPGIDPEAYRLGEYFFRIPGAVDHRGNEIAPLNIPYLTERVARCRSKGITSFAVVSKFSTRNPEHEQRMALRIDGESERVTMGHTLSGSLNFPRRIATAYYNAAVQNIFSGFTTAVRGAMEELGLGAELNVLKADGGTFGGEQAEAVPVQSVFSGPTASVMGVLSLVRPDRDAVVVDIGGTTTDIALLAGGTPLLERHGISILDRPTLIRALRVRSIAMGGDSEVRLKDGQVCVGPGRLGPCLAAGGPAPTLMDAVNVLGLGSYGDQDLSRRGLAFLAEELGCGVEHLARIVVDLAVAAIARVVREEVGICNEMPVYTIHELLAETALEPQQVVCIGGPAAGLAGELGEALLLEPIVPEYAGVANAVGAAMTGKTMEVELFADTARRKLHVPALSVLRSIAASYDLERGREEAVQYLREAMEAQGVELDPDEVQILQADSFTMVEGFSRVGRNIRVRCQRKPGVAPVRNS